MNIITKWQSKFNTLPRLPKSCSKLGYVDILTELAATIIKKRKYATRINL